MDNHSIHEEGFSQHMGQHNIPSPDAAWQDMLHKLEKEMPVADVLTKEDKKIFSHNNALYLVVLLLLLLNIKHTKEVLHTQQPASRFAKTFYTNNNNAKLPAVPALGETAPTKTQVQTTSNKHLQNIQLPFLYKTSNSNRVLKTILTPAQKEENIPVEKDLLKDTAAASAGDEAALLNNQKALLKAVQPNDSLQNNKEEAEDNPLNMQAGLQWTLPVPIAGTQNYFAGPSANQQAWRVLLPGAWVNVTAGKDMLMAEVNPFAAASFHPKAFFSNQQSDSVSILETYKSITKVFGISGAVSFQRNIGNNWWVGGGLQTNFWRKGVAVLRVNEHNTVTNVSSAAASLYVLSKDDWQYFSKFQLYPQVQLMYRSTNCQAGLRSGITFTPLATKSSAKNLAFTEVFFRLPLISNKHK